MIPRYAREQMVSIWSPETKFRIWFEIEAHATDALAELGVVPKTAAKALWDWWATNPAIDVPLERVTVSSTVSSRPSSR